MPIPFETFLPYGIILGMFCVSGVGLGSIRYYNSGGKRPRWNVTTWDKYMMDRDARLTGFERGQVDRVKAPEGFEVNNPWEIEYLARRGFG